MTAGWGYGIMGGMPPRTSRKPSMPPTSKGSEHWHQATFIGLIRRLPHAAGRLTFAIPNGFMKTKAMRIRGWKEGVLSGVADVFTPIAESGRHGLWIEFKVRPNVLSDEQKRFRVEMEAQGYAYVIAYTWEEALKAWCDYLGITVQLS